MLGFPEFFWVLPGFTRVEEEFCWLLYRTRSQSIPSSFSRMLSNFSRMLSSIDWISSQLDEFLSKLNDLSRDFGVVFHRDSLVDLFRDEAGVELPPKGHYATGICFVDEASRAQSEAMFQDIATECSLQVLDDSSRKNRKCDYTELGKAICCPIRSREALKNEQYISFSQHRKEGKIDTPIMSGNIATRRARLTVKTFEI